MNFKELSLYINSNKTLDSTSYENIEALINEYPYFQIGQILLLKNLYKNEDIKFGSQLKKTAIHVSDRKKLNKIITSNVSEIDYDKNSVKLLKLSESSYNIKEATTTKSKEYPSPPLLSFNFDSSISKDKSKEYKDSIIDKFISNNPKISRTSDTTYSTPEKVTKSLVDNDDYISETLAKIYAQQNNIEKAIRTYEKLCLKYPEKNTFFAKKIKELKKTNK